MTRVVNVLCSFMMLEDGGGLGEAGLPSIALELKENHIIKDVNAKLRDYITKYLDERYFVVQGFYHHIKGKTREVSYKDSTKLEGDRAIGDVSLHERGTIELAMFAVCKMERSNTEMTRWSPPSGSGISETTKISISLLRDGYPHESRQRYAVNDDPNVEGRFVKFVLNRDGLMAFRFTGRLSREEAVGISYAWGTLEHKPRLRVSVFDVKKKCDVGKEHQHHGSTQHLDLGAEWNVRRLQTKLVQLSKDRWLWMDQLCLQKDADLSNVLSSNISRIYANCEVHALVATWRCEAFQKLQSDYKRTERERYFQSVEEHTQTCDCSRNWQIYFGRIWPWHELALSSKVNFHLGLGEKSVDTRYDRRHTIDKARSQIGVKLGHRFYAMRDKDAEQASNEAAMLVILGWSVECPRRHKIVVRESYDFLTHVCKAGRDASKKIDFMFAMIPLMGMDITLELSGVNKEEQLKPGLKQLERAFLGAMNRVTREPFARAWLESKHLGTAVKDTNDLLPHVRSSSLMEGKHDHNLTSYQTRGDAARCSVTTLYDAKDCHRGIELASIFHWLSREQRGELRSFTRVERHGGCDEGIMTAICAYLEEPPKKSSQRASIKSALTTMSVALGYIAPTDAERFKQKGSEKFALVGVSYNTIGSDDELRALAIQIQAKDSTALCFSYNASLIGAVKRDKYFEAYGQVLGSRVHHSIRTWCARHTLDTMLNKKKGEYKIKMPDARLQHN